MENVIGQVVNPVIRKKTFDIKGEFLYITNYIRNQIKKGTTYLSKYGKSFFILDNSVTFIKVDKLFKVNKSELKKISELKKDLSKRYEVNKKILEKAKLEAKQEELYNQLAVIANDIDVLKIEIKNSLDKPLIAEDVDDILKKKLLDPNDKIDGKELFKIYGELYSSSRTEDEHKHSSS